MSEVSVGRPVDMGIEKGEATSPEEIQTYMENQRKEKNDAYRPEDAAAFASRKKKSETLFGSNEGISSMGLPAVVEDDYTYIILIGLIGAGLVFYFNRG